MITMGMVACSMADISLVKQDRARMLGIKNYRNGWFLDGVGTLMFGEWAGDLEVYNWSEAYKNSKIDADDILKLLQEAKDIDLCVCGTFI